MITEKEKQWLQDYYLHPEKYTKRKTLYMKRIQKQIEKNMENAIWLAQTYPHVLLNDKNFGTHPRYQRLQKLLLLIKILKPQYDVYLEIAKDSKEILKID